MTRSFNGFPLEAQIASIEHQNNNELRRSLIDHLLIHLELDENVLNFKANKISNWIVMMKHQFINCTFGVKHVLKFSWLFFAWRSFYSLFNLTCHSNVDTSIFKCFVFSLEMIVNVWFIFQTKRSIQWLHDVNWNFSKIFTNFWNFYQRFHLKMISFLCFLSLLSVNRIKLSPSNRFCRKWNK